MTNFFFSKHTMQVWIEMILLDIHIGTFPKSRTQFLVEGEESVVAFLCSTTHWFIVSTCNRGVRVCLTFSFREIKKKNSVECLFKKKKKIPWENLRFLWNFPIIFFKLKGFLLAMLSFQYPGFLYWLCAATAAETVKHHSFNSSIIPSILFNSWLLQFFSYSLLFRLV